MTQLAGLATAIYAIATVGLWFIARPYGELKWKLASASALAAAAVAMLANQVIAHVWDRSRPYTTHGASDHLLSAPSVDPSFPSDHAAAAFAIAFAVLAYSRRGGIAFLLASTLIGLSRIALGMHYPSDVLAGALVGWLAAMLVTGPGGFGSRASSSSRAVPRIPHYGRSGDAFSFRAIDSSHARRLARRGKMNACLSTWGYRSF